MNWTCGADARRLTADTASGRFADPTSIVDERAQVSTSDATRSIAAARSRAGANTNKPAGSRINTIAFIDLPCDSAGNVRALRGNKAAPIAVVTRSPLTRWD